jgi:hypothetical protein
MTFGGEIKKMEITPYPYIFDAYKYGESTQICLFDEQLLLHQLFNKVVSGSTLLCFYGNNQKE